MSVYVLVVYVVVRSLACVCVIAGAFSLFLAVYAIGGCSISLFGRVCVIVLVALCCLLTFSPFLFVGSWLSLASVMDEPRRTINTPAAFFLYVKDAQTCGVRSMLLFVISVHCCVHVLTCCFVRASGWFGPPGM